MTNEINDVEKKITKQKKTCCTCRFRNECGRCFRFPPHYIKEWSKEEQSYISYNHHPEVRDNDYCGEYKLNPTFKQAEEA